jgi:hypothetical protein
MTRARHILAIDQGTTSTRSIVFSDEARNIAVAQREFQQHYPAAGWVEHDAEDIWRDTLATAREALARSGLGARGIAAIGITNQRETAVVWDRSTGVPIHRAIVWQDRRTADVCATLKRDGAENLVRQKTGLLLDPYFSGTKVAWLLDNVPGARGRAERGELAFGTIDSFLLWRLTGGRTHATDVTNASRTLLFDIHRQVWDDELLRLIRVPRAMLPEVRDSSEIYGETADGLFEHPIPIAGIAGDQQAALVGQACFEPGMVKSTYGTGCFMLLNTGDSPVESRNRLLTTVAYRIKGRTTYAMDCVSSAKPRTPPRSRSRCRRITAFISFPRSSDSAPPTGIPTRAGSSAASRWIPRVRILRAPRSSRWRIRRSIWPPPWRGTAPRVRPPSALTAAWPPMIGSANSSPMCSMRASSVRPSSRRRRSARPFWPASRPACGRTSMPWRPRGPEVPGSRPK